MGFCLVVGLLILSSLWLYLDRLGQQQSDEWGQHLALQLADEAHQPMLYSDNISLQVLVNKLSNSNTQLLQASIFDVDDQLQAQSTDTQNQEDSQTSVYTSHIYVEDSIAGYVQLTIDSGAIKESLLILFWATLFTWLISSALLCVGLGLIGRNLSLRLSGLTAALPNSQEPVDQDEIDRLEASIRPLLVMPQIDQRNSQDSASLILSICCENIQRLQAQLTQKNYHSLVKSFDAVSNCAVKLFDAERLPGSKHCINLSFSCDGDQDNALIRAASCFVAIQELVRESTPESGAGLVLCAAMCKTETLTINSQFLQDQQRELILQELVNTTAMADPWQLLIQASLVVDTVVDIVVDTVADTVAEIVTGVNEGQSPETISAVNYEVLPNAEDQVLFTSLKSNYQATLAGQLAYIRSQLPGLDNSLLNEVAS